MLKNSTDSNTGSNKATPCSTCAECLENLYLMIDGEATNEQEEFFQKHLDECAPCFNSYNMEKSVKEFLNSRIERRAVPQSLVDTIKNKIGLLA